MGLAFRLRQSSCNQHGSGFTIVTRIFPIFILPPLVPIRAPVFRAFYVRQRWSNIWLPKMKTNRGAAKRFKVTGTGKIVRHKAFASHILTKKATKRKRNLRQTNHVRAEDAGRLDRMLPYL